MKSNSCDAFPDGIPEEIILSQVLHTQPHLGDNGIQFEPLGEEDDQ